MVRYLIEERKERENEAIRRFLWSKILLVIFFELLGLPFPSYWCICNVNKKHLSDFEGDGDIIAGRLELNNSGKIKKWPPPADYLIGLEVKCAYLNPQANYVIPTAHKMASLLLIFLLVFKKTPSINRKLNFLLVGLLS